MTVRAAVLTITFAILSPTPGEGWFVPIEGGRFARDRNPSIAIASDGRDGVIMASNLISAGGLEPAPLTVLRLAPGGEETWRTVLSESKAAPVTHGWVQELLVDGAGRHVYVSALLFRDDPLVFYGTIAKIDVASGAVVWQRRSQESNAGTDQTLPVAVAPDGSVFIAYVERLSRTLFVEKLDGASGALVWRVDHGHARLWVKVTADEEGNVLVASENGDVAFVVKVNGSDGEAAWRYEDKSVGVPLVRAGGAVFYGGSALPFAVDRTVPLLARLDPSEGHPIWQVGLDSSVYAAAETVDLAVTPSGMPVTAGRLVRQIDDDNYENRFGVIAFDAGTGAQRWLYLMPEDSWIRDIAVDADGILVAGTTDNGLGTYRSDFFVTKVDHEAGEAMWEYEVPSLGGGWAEQIAVVDGDAAVAAGTIGNRTTGCGVDTDLVAVKLRSDTGELFAPNLSPTPRPLGRCTDHILYVTSTSAPLDYESPARGRLTFIDGLTLDPLAAVDVGERPTQVVVDPRRPVVYVVDPGDRWWTEGATAGRVFEIDIPSREIVAEAEVGIGAGSIAITGDGEKLYVSNLLAASVSVLATKPLRMLDSIEGVDSPAAVASNDLREELYVVTEEGVLHVLDTATDQVVRSVRITEAAHSVSVAPNGATIFVSGSYPDRSIFAVDASTLETSGKACCSRTDFSAGALAFTADGSTALLAHDDLANPVVLDIASGVFEATEVDCSVAVDGLLYWNHVGSVAVRGDRGYAGPYAVDLPSRTVVGQIEPNDLRGGLLGALGVAVGPCVEALEHRSEPDDDGCQVARRAGLGPGRSYVYLLAGLALALLSRRRQDGDRQA